MEGTEQKKVGLFSLTALVIGSMIGGGVFNLPKDMASGAGGLAIIIGWVITAIGMVTLGLCFQNLTMKRPDLEGGVYSYARAGFGEFMGFNSAWGYWVSAFLGNVAYGTLLFSSIGYFFPVFEGGQNVASIIGASVLLWGVHWLVLQGVHSATIINAVVTIAKMVPLLLFIVVMIFAFHIKEFSLGFLGNLDSFSWSGVGAQVKSTMLVTLWVFIGIEGAVVFSTRAKNRSDIGKATVMGLLGTILIYILVTLLSLGVMSQEEIAALDNPSMGYILEHVVGKWGAVVINAGIIVAVLGAWLGWTMLAAEIPMLAAKDKVFPKWFGKLNKNEAASNSMWLTNGLIQVFLLTFLVTEEAYEFAFSLASSAILVPYVFSALYQAKYSLKSKESDRMRNIIIGFVASIYGIWLVIAAGMDYLLLTMIIYALGIVVFWMARKENKAKKIFTTVELVIAIAFVILAIFAIYQLATGHITI
ncbi:arginine-ornithine antiporter [Bacillus sp. 1P06AnD]|uniref:arginine-ornithine antiporter n=1 Tax=Bacillus sp. 1P06AnD TaxID=3132208 RepID=UPI0039A29D7F